MHSGGFLYFYHQGQAVTFEIGRDDSFIKELISTAMDFWSSVTSRKEPDKDPERDLFLPQGPAEQQWQQLAANYRQNALYMDDLKTQLKDLAAQQDILEQQLVVLMGDYLSAEHSGLRVNRFQVQGPIDYKAACQTLLPEFSETTFESYRKEPGDRVRITCRNDNGNRAEVPFDAAMLKDLVSCDYWF